MIVPNHIEAMIKRLRARWSDEEARARLRPKMDVPRRIRPVLRTTTGSITALWERLFAEQVASTKDREALADPQTLTQAERYSANIENMIGTVKVPVGLMGPLRMNGLHAQGDYYIPLATTEAALVASFSRGADLVTAAGGVSAALVYEAVLRAPAFRMADLLDAGRFAEWVVQNQDKLRSAAEATTRYGKLVFLQPVIDSEIVYLQCRYTTGDASGQNIVTIATDALCQYVLKNCPVQIRNWYIDGNFSGDKKASSIGLMTGRGRKVSANALLPASLIEKKLRITVNDILEYGKVANLGSLLSGQMGAQAQFANGLAAFYLATGQDVACVAESAVGFTRMEDHGGDLFVSVTLPNIMVGTVGGGTGLPSQAAGLSILGLQGEGKAAALAEITAAICLCGELSIIAAIAAGDFAKAHEKLARHR